MSDITYTPPLPVAVRVGDLTLDGYPDIIIIGVSGSGDRTPYILYSVSCSSNIAGCDSNGRGRRGFQTATAGTEAMKHILDARGITVMDLDEDVGCSFLSSARGSIVLFLGDFGHPSPADRSSRPRHGYFHTQQLLL